MVIGALLTPAPSGPEATGARQWLICSRIFSLLGFFRFLFFGLRKNFNYRELAERPSFSFQRSTSWRIEFQLTLGEPALCQGVLIRHNAEFFTSLQKEAAQIGPPHN
jgi:hypothetical protein